MWERYFLCLAKERETVLHSKESHQRETPFGIPYQVYTPPPPYPPDIIIVCINRTNTSASCICHTEPAIVQATQVIG